MYLMMWSIQYLLLSLHPLPIELVYLNMHKATCLLTLTNMEWQLDLPSDFAIPLVVIQIHFAVSKIALQTAQCARINYTYTGVCIIGLL